MTKRYAKQPRSEINCISSEMNQNHIVRLFVSAIFSLLLIISLPNISSGGAFTESIKIKIVHSHDDSEHHSHSHDTDKNESAEDHSNHDSTSHSHEIVLVSGVAYVTSQVSSFIALELPKESHPFSLEALPPNNPNLDSIFRPPIA